MAFQFPDPSVATTVVNQDTGITYQWQDPPGKWVIAVETLDTYCVEQQTSTLELNADGQAEFYTDFEITGDKILTNTVNETVDYIVSYEGIEERVSNLSDDQKQYIGFVEIRKDKYISQATPDAALITGVKIKQVVTMFDIAGVEFQCISPERILFGPGTPAGLGPQGTVAQPLQCCHKFIAPVRIGSAYVIISEDPPEKGLVEGLLWFSSKDTEYNLFVYCEDENIWVPASPNIGEIEQDKYVKKAGDTMTGALTMENASMLETINTDIEMRRTMPNDGSGDWDVNRSRYGIIRSRCPKIIDTDGTENLAQGQPFGIQIDLADRNSYRNELKVTSKTEDILRVYSGATPGIEFNDQIDRSNLTASGNDKGIIQGIEIRGIPTPDKDITPGSYAVNKEYIDQREAYLQNEIVELAEEIEALAPSVERGEWQMTLSGVISGPGLITFYDGTFGNGNPTGVFTQVQSVWFSETDKASVPHGFENVETGHLLELFVQGESDYGLFEVVEVHDETNNIQHPYYAIDVNFVRALSNTSKADTGDMVRMKTFQAPSGGTASEFVRKIGDDMEGPLVFKDNGIIDGSDAQSMPTTPGDPNDPGYRAGLEIRTVADKPIAISHDGSYKSVLDIYKYDPNEPNNRGKTLSIYADGRVITPKYFQTTEFVRTPILKSKDNEDLRVQRGDHNTIELKSNIVEINNPLQVNQYLKLVSNGTDNGKTYIYYNEPNDSYNQIRIQLNKKGSISDSGNTGGGALWYRRDGLVTSALTWGKDGITLSDYADKKLDIGQCPVINVPDPVDEQDATNKRYVDLLSAKIEELEQKIANLGGGSGSMSRNVRLTVQGSSTSPYDLSVGEIKTFNAATDTISVCARGIAFKPQGRINISKVSRSATDPIWSFHITDVKYEYLSSNKDQVATLSVSLEGPEGSGGNYGINSSTDYYLSIVDGAWDSDTAVSSSVKFSASSSGDWDNNSPDTVVNVEKLYKLNSSGNLTDGSYVYGAFIPIPYLEKMSGLKYVNLRDDASGKFGSNATNNVEEATLNGIKGIKVWKSSSYYYTNTIAIHVYGANMIYDPDS